MGVFSRTEINECTPFHKTSLKLDAVHILEKCIHGFFVVERNFTLSRNLEQDVFHVGLQFHPDVHLLSSSKNTQHAHSLLLGGHLYFHELFISLAPDPVI